MIEPTTSPRSPLISVMMPVYNAESYVGAAIESILKQTERNFELIIVNDGSTDGSERIIESYNDPRIVHVFQPNQGEAEARNTALGIARGKFIAFQDADDLSLPIRFEVMLHHFTSPDIGFVHSDMLLIDSNSLPTAYWQSRQIERERMLRYVLRLGTPFNNPSAFLRREVFTGERYETLRRFGTDTDMMLRIALRWRTVHIPEPLYLYRRHDQQLTNGSNEEAVLPYLRKFLSSFRIQDLVPEVLLTAKPMQEQHALGMAIVALFLSQRGFWETAAERYQIALNSASEPENRLLIQAIGEYADRHYEPALRLLEQIKVRDHIVENYLGEVLALGFGKAKEAMEHYLAALALQPEYAEPIENLKNLGTAQSYDLIDRRWQFFRR